MAIISKSLLLGLASLYLTSTVVHAADSGCGKEPAGAAGKTTTVKITSAKLQRNFLVHVPKDYDQNNKYPVVFAFHGSGETADEMEIDTRLSDPQWSKDKIVVYPNGIGEVWAGAGYSNTTIKEDLQFTSDMIDNLRSGYCIDDNRIYATGLSNGAGWVDVLACSGDDIGKQFAAFVPCSGAYYTEHWSNFTCKPARTPTPMIIIHGLKDTTVPYNGAKQGNGGFLEAISIVVNSWAERNKCTKKTEQVTDGGIVHHTSWDCGGVDAVLQHYREDDMKHVWASRNQTFSQLIENQGPTKIESNEIMMKFFDRFSLDKEKDDTASVEVASSVLLATTQDLGTVTKAEATQTGTASSKASKTAASASASATATEAAGSATTNASASASATGAAVSVFKGSSVVAMVVSVGAVLLAVL